MYDFARVYVTFLGKNALFALLNRISNNVYCVGDTEYESALEFIETLMEVVGDNPEDPHWGLAVSSGPSSSERVSLSVRAGFSLG